MRMMINEKHGMAKILEEIIEYAEAFLTLAAGILTHGLLPSLTGRL